MEHKKILMVCLGNICRSPLAQGILNAKVNHLNIKVDSIILGILQTSEVLGLD
jgi:protein-tyrosine phosphatase